MMTAKERLTKALKGQSVDRPPFICPGGMMNMVTTEVMQRIGSPWPDAHSSPQLLAKLALGVHQLTGIENLGVPFCMTAEAEALGARADMGNLMNEPRVVGYPLSMPAEYVSLPEIKTNGGRIQVILDAVEILAENELGLPVIANLTGPISLATSLVEPMNFYKAMGKQPQIVHHFLTFITGQLIVLGKALSEAGAQIITIADPSATGEILGPRRFNDFALPYLNQIFDALSGNCQASMVHICGRLHSIFMELNQLKTGAISIDSATSVLRIKEAVPQKVIVGNVSTHLLLTGHPEKVQTAALSSLRQGAAILAPACGISTGTPLVNLQAMARAAREFNLEEQAV